MVVNSLSFEVSYRIIYLWSQRYRSVERGEGIQHILLIYRLVTFLPMWFVSGPEETEGYVVEEF
jgi:hypothetical protein